MRTWGLLLALWLPGPARAIGLCEETRDHFELYQVSEKLAEVAVRREKEYCEPTDSEEHRETFKFVSITDRRGRAKAMFLDDPAPEVFARFQARLGKLARPQAELGPYLSAGGFHDPVAPGTATAKGCQGQVTRVPVSGGFVLWLDVSREGKRLARLWIGKGEGDGEIAEQMVKAGWFAPRFGFAVSYVTVDSAGYQDPYTDGPDLYERQAFGIIGAKKLAACF